MRITYDFHSPRVHVKSLAIAASTAACLIASHWLLDGSPSVSRSAETTVEASKGSPDRSPVDLVLSDDGHWLLTANETSDSVSLVDVAKGEVVDEIRVGHRPKAVALVRNQHLALVSCTWSGELHLLDLSEGRLRSAGKVQVGFDPVGVVATKDGKTAYVARETAGDVAVVDLESKRVTGHIGVGRWPRYLALSPDGSRLAVGANGERAISVVDTASKKLLYDENFGGINAGQMQISADNQFVYFPWMIYRTNPVTDFNVRKGWVLGSRIARIRLDGPARRQAITLDPQGEAVSDPHGLALSPDEQWLVATGSGTHELLVYKLPGLPFEDYGGPGDHLDAQLRADKRRHYRIPLDGRPMGVRFAADGQRVFVANYLTNAVQEVDLERRAVVRSISLGGPQEPSLARQGEAIFFDGRRSLDQWYSCHTCHYEGGTSAVPMDTTNDGTNGTFKTVLSLYNCTRTGPWTWHGWQTDLHAAMRKSITESMLGRPPTTDDVKGLVAFLDTLQPPPNPYRQPDGGLTMAAERGKLVFESEKAGCSNCHLPPYYTDGQIHDVGLGSKVDAYKGFNTPSLIGVHRKVRLLHNGQATNLTEVLTGAHNPAKVTGKGELTEQELADLVEFVKSL